MERVRATGENRKSNKWMELQQVGMEIMQQVMTFKDGKALWGVLGLTPKLFTLLLGKQRFTRLNDLFFKSIRFY